MYRYLLFSDSIEALFTIFDAILEFEIESIKHNRKNE